MSRNIHAHGGTTQRAVANSKYMGYLYFRVRVRQKRVVENNSLTAYAEIRSRDIYTIEEAFVKSEECINAV